MPRFSLLSYRDTNDFSQSSDSEYETSRQYDDDELVYSDDEDDVDDHGDQSSVDDEPPHPLGFQSSGRTRYALDPNPKESIEHYKHRWGYLHPFQDVNDDDDWFAAGQPQKYPPLSSYIDSNTAPSQVLIRYALSDSNRRHRHDEHGDKEIDQVAQLLQAAAIVDEQYIQRLIPARPSKSYPIVVDNTATIQREMEQERLRVEQEHMEAAKALQMLLDKNEAKAKRILAEEKRIEQERQRREKERAEAQQKAQQEQREKEEAERKEQEEEAAAEEQAVREAKAKEAKEKEYVAKGRKLVAQLVQVRASVETFDKSKAVAKRRLGMKKIVNGKVNTLAENVDKIRSVAQEVSQAIHTAREEDEQIKQQIQSGNSQQFSPEMARGKRYLVDLLCSKVIVRAQADGFNGQRGDGFPLANMLALLSVDNKELAPLLAAHIYTVCPTAIPTLPHASAGASEEEFMKSLGMLKDKDGEFESFAQFLHRTEGIISLVADIMASEPSAHTLLGGHEGAIKWLQRFLSLLPEPPQSPLPLLTAPVLDAFLTGAGHMLANKHPDEFKGQLDTIMKDTINRLDEGPVGKPSSIRLKKAVEGGFEKFKTKLPPRALAELYNGASEAEQGGQLSTFGSAPFATGSSVPAPAPTGFGTQAPAPSPFGTAAPAPSPFGASSTGFAQQPATSSGTTEVGGGAPPFGSSSTGFGQQSAVSSGQSPFGTAVATPSPFGESSAVFGQQSSGPSGTEKRSGQKPPCRFFAEGRCRRGQNCKFSHELPSGGGSVAQQAPSTFGGSQAPGPSPFGGPGNQNMNTSAFAGGAPTPSPFGGSSPFGASANTPAPFGSQAPGPSPFGGVQSTANVSPFGGGQASGTSPFGGNPAPSPSPFGGNQPPNPSPFGGGAPAPSPFGGGVGQQSSPFGGPAPSPSPFGGGTGQQSSPFGGGAPAPSSFGGSVGQKPSPFGGPAPSPSPFSAQAPSPSPFGAQGPAPSPFGGQAPAAPFGGNQFSSPSPFGSNQGTASSPFGGGGGGGGNRRPPCKFFAEGRCRHGENCRFSHDTQPGGIGGGSSFSNPFGGPRR